MPRHAAIDVDLDAITANVRAIRRWIGPRVRLVAVVKAQGYGLGAGLIASAALEAGADALAVARVREGVRLRRLGVKAPILLLTAFTPAEVRDVAAHELTPTVVDVGQLALLARAADRASRRFAIFEQASTRISPASAIRRRRGVVYPRRKPSIPCPPGTSASAGA